MLLLLEITSEKNKISAQHLHSLKARGAAERWLFKVSDSHCCSGKKIKLSKWDDMPEVDCEV